MRRSRRVKLPDALIAATALCHGLELLTLDLGLQAGGTLLGKGDAVQRLCGNLQVDIAKARTLLGWVPPVAVSEGLRRLVGI